MNLLNFNQTRFLKSVAELSQLPPDQGAEVAFAGRSNAGKSTAINAITAIGHLARASKTPGRTQLINYFEVDSVHRLVDLPGYGFAKVPTALKLHWQALMNAYLIQRQSLNALFLMMDIRHPLTPTDWQMIQWAVGEELPIHILLTKADKLKRGPGNSVLLNIRKELSGYENFISIQLFSAMSHQGVEEAREKLNSLLSLEEEIF